MAEKEVRIGLRTDLKGTGLQDAGKQLDNVDAKAKAGAKSIDALTAEARELERALGALEPGTEEFERTATNLGKVRGEMQRTVDLADTFATKAGGAGAGVKNIGMYATQTGYQLQDFFVQVGAGQSVLTAFAQQGSQLAGMFGPGGAMFGAGLAIAAVLAKVLQIKSETKDAKAFKGLVDAFKDIGEQTTKLVDQRKDIEKESIADIFDKEKEAIDRQTKAFMANIDAMKQRITAAGALDKITTAAALAAVDAKLATGQMKATAEKPNDPASQKAADERLAIEQKQAIERAAKERELQRSIELSKLSEEVAKAEEAKAKAEKEAAERQRQAAEESLKASDAVIKWLQTRADLAKQLSDLSKEYLGSETKIFDFKKADTPDMLEMNKNNASEQSAEKTAGVDAMFAGLQRLLDMGGLPDATTLQSLQEKNGELLAAFGDAKDAVEAATKRLTDATDARGVAEQSGAAERSSMGANAAAEAIQSGLENKTADYQRTGEEAGEKIAKVFESWVTSLGANAEAEKPAALIEQVRKMLADGLQGGEGDQLLQVITEVARLVGTNNTKTMQGFVALKGTVELNSSQLATIVRDLETMRNQVREMSKAR